MKLPTLALALTICASGGIQQVPLGFKSPSQPEVMRLYEEAVRLAEGTDMGRAQSAFQSMVQTAEQLNDEQGQALAHFFLVNVIGKKHKFIDFDTIVDQEIVAEILSHLDVSVRYFRKTGDQYGLGRSLHRRSILIKSTNREQSIHEVTEAAQLLTKDLERQVLLPTARYAILSWQALAALRLEGDEPDLALAALEPTDGIVRSFNGPEVAKLESENSWTLALSAQANLDLGNFDQVLSIAKKTARLKSAETNLACQLEAAIAEMRLGRPNDAFERLKQLKTSRDEDKIRVLNVEVSVLDKLGRRDEALAKANLVLDHFQKTQPGSTAHAEALNNVGWLLMQESEPSGKESLIGARQQAADNFRRALEMQCNDPVGRANTLGNLGLAHHLLGDDMLAVAYLKDAANASQERRKGLFERNPEADETFAKTMELTYTTLYRVLVEQGRFAESQRALEMFEGERLGGFDRRNVLGLAIPEIRIGKLDLETQATKSAVETYGSFRDTVASYEALVKKTERTADEDRRLEELRRSLDKAHSAFWSGIDELEKQAVGQFRDLTPGEIADKLKLLASKLTGTTARLKAKSGVKVATAIVYADEQFVHTAMTLGDSGTLLTHKCPMSGKELNIEVGKCLEELVNDALDPRPRLDKLRQALFGDLFEILVKNEVKHLQIDLAGSVRALPFDALWIEGQEKWLCDLMTVSRFNLVSEDRLTDEAPKTWSVAAFGNAVNAKGRRDIPEAEEESSKIASLFRTKAVNGPAFTKAALKAQAARPDVNVLHFATHFALEPGSVRQSFLLLGASGPDLKARSLDLNELRSQTASEWGLKEVIVYSACESAVPETADSQLEGLAGYTKDKGPATVIASLWNVDDTATRKLMVRFYELVAQAQKDGKPWRKSQCLAQAAAELRTGKLGKPGDKGWGRGDPAPRVINTGAQPWPKDSKELHPRYWAPFVLFGNWL